jgi:hypothetical protein
MDLCRLVEECFGAVYCENGMLRLLHDLGLSWQKARPVHPEADREAQARFRKIPGADGPGRPRPADFYWRAESSEWHYWLQAAVPPRCPARPL